MWKWFALLAVCLFLLAGGAAIYRHFESEAVADEQRPFLEAIESGDPAKLTALMDESLPKRIDPALLETWMQVVQAKLGKVEGFEITSRTETKSGDVTIVVSEARIRFARGNGDSQLVFRDGRLSDFAIKSPKLGSWLEDLPDTSSYETAGREFILNFFGNKPKEAFLAMDPSTLQQSLPMPKLIQAMQALSAKGGKLHEVRVIGKKFTPAGDSQKAPTLTIDYELVCENAKTAAHLIYAFAGLKGRLIAFRFD